MDKEVRNGIFICRCGPNIAEKLHFDKLKEIVAKYPDTIDVYEDNFFCSPAGKEKIIEIIKKDNLNRCCFAACSHRVHEKTFMDTVEKAGMNPYMIQMANVREHITWVVNDKDKATERAASQIKAAVSRLRFHKEIEQKKIKIKTDVAIIGGGIAGIKAAKVLARDNRTVYLIEKEPTLGGYMPKWEKSFPTMDCNTCFLAPELSEIKDIENIKVITQAEVNEIKGFYGNFIIKLKKKARYVNENCIGCMECFNVCPVSVKNEFNAGMDERKAVYIPFPGACPNLALIDEEDCLRFKGEECTKCKEACMFEAVNYDDKDEEMELEVGGIINATGFDLIDIKETEKYNYDSKNNIFSGLEFERMMSSSGPTGGHIKKRDGADPESIAVVYCGGREKAGYCSGVCCGAAMKYARFMIDHNPKTKIYQIYSEMSLNIPGLQEMKEGLEQSGVEFIKIDDFKDVTLEQKNAEVKINFKKYDKEKNITADLAVISMGTKDSESGKKISDMLGLDYTKEGWIAKKHSKMEPSISVIEGIYVAGFCGGPVDVSGAVTSAKAAAGEALSKLIPGKEIELEPKITYTDEEKCGACKLCISVCPYKAISFDEEKGVSSVSEVLCMGCGTCVSLCPAGALINKHFEDEQIDAEIETLLVKI